MSVLIIMLVILLIHCAGISSSPMVASPGFLLSWTHLSSANGDLPPPSDSTEQTAAMILDVDKDGLNDFVIGNRRAGPAMVWYQRNQTGWTKNLIDDATLDIEAGGAFYDIDRDGDLDVVIGGDDKSNKVWWWENPYPIYDPNAAWTRREIKNSGENKHHDQIFGDFDGDGQAELVFWNQKAKKLFLADIPSDPKATQPWPFTEIYSWSSGQEHEGLAKADIDGDGQIDIVGGGRWFKHNGGSSYTANVIDDTQRFSRAAAGQLKAGGRPEVVFVVGDGSGRLKWYEWNGNTWVGQDLLGFDVDHGHSLEVADMNRDGHLDIFVAEMRLNGGNDDAKIWLFLGDGEGNFTQEVVATGYGNHESKIDDLDGDGDMDILGKPYNWDTPRVDIWLNLGCDHSALDNWQRHVVDASKPWQAVFITSADMDGDGQQDIITGAWWYRNPGNPSGTWTRHTIGSPLNNMAAVYDFDGDSDMDVLGTKGQGSSANDAFVWARNDGSGSFTILDNVSNGEGDFLQGVAVERFQVGGNLEVALSWHQGGNGVQMLTVPPSPASDIWAWQLASPTSQDEALSKGDIDRDGDMDLLLGTKWLRNDGTSWSAFILNDTGGEPDRNRLVDINKDGRLDAVVGFEAISKSGKLAWYEQGSEATLTWAEHVITNVIGPMSLDVADMDRDGDVDVVVGEHNMSDPSSAKLYVYENDDGQGGLWTEHMVYTGDEHHDGAQVVDIDGDGDLDIISIGWSHGRVLLYENRGNPCGRGASTYLPILLETSEPTGQVEVGGTRVVAGLQALYTFAEGSGTTIYDVSGVGTPLNLSIREEAAVRWLPAGGLAVSGPTLIASSGAATGVIEATKTSNELTIEVWVKPVSTSQQGPARIVTLSTDLHNRNFTLGQGLWGNQPSDVFDVRLRTTATDNNGMPSASTPVGSVSPLLTHLVYTRDASGVVRVYVNNAERASGTVGGDFANWDESFRLALANELTTDRPWLGELFLVAVYSQALGQAEITQNYNAGPQGQH